ncbi:MAG: alpha/beta hydrolase domain-containing protein [Acidobacteriota bacterium]
MTSLVVLAVAIGMTTLAHGQGPAPAPGQTPAQGQGQGQGRGQGGPGGGGGRGPAAVPPQNLTAVVLPTVTGPITGPGLPYESVQSLAPRKGLADFKYDAKEYFISGTANGQPYRTRIVVRKPSSNAKFSGMVLVEPMHPSGSAHMFEMTSIYTMTSGHAAVDISAGGLQQVIDANPERYKGFQVGNGQVSEIIAQVGALVKSKDPNSPFAGLTVKKMVLGGTSATAGTLIGYLPFHMVFRTPDMQRIFDGFMPTSNGSVIRQIDVPMVHVPTMLEVSNANITTRPDGDAPGDQYRVYEFPGMGHVDSRDNVRLTPNPCAVPLSTFPMQAYMSIGLHYLYQWVDKGIAPPKADRILKDGAAMAVDEQGNPKGGIRNPYVDVPATKYGVPNRGANPLPASLSPYVTKGGQQAANQMCGLSAFQNDYSKEELTKLYGNKKAYKSKVEKRLSELEKAGWSLPMYHDMIMADAAKVDF